LRAAKFLELSGKQIGYARWAGSEELHSGKGDQR